MVPGAADPQTGSPSRARCRRGRGPAPAWGVAVVAVCALALGTVGARSAAAMSTQQPGGGTFRSDALTEAELRSVYVDPFGCDTFRQAAVRGHHSLRASWWGSYGPGDDSFVQQVDLRAEVEGTIDDADGHTWRLIGFFGQQGTLPFGTDLRFDGEGALVLFGPAGAVVAEATLRIVAGPGEIALRFTDVALCERMEDAVSAPG